MIVQELIEQLECCDPESDVLIDAGGVTLIEADHVDDRILLNVVVISQKRRKQNEILQG